MTGADRLIAEGWESATGLGALAVGVATNHTGRLSDGTHLVDALLDSGVEVVAIFSPEHGFEGMAAEGARIYSAGETYRDVVIHSLYGTSTRPDEAMLQEVDVFLFDIQDVGARFYTYTSTMARTMEAAAARGIPYVVLDRPDPIGGRIIEGPVLREEYSSFVGLYPVPIRHGFTIGEYALWMIGEGHIPGGEDLDLRVVEMKEWTRGMWYSDTGVPWVQPSPNMATPATALVYPGICFVEGTNVSEGRGTEQPFELVGAPWADDIGITSWLNGLGLAGVQFHPATFTPGIPGTSVEVKWKGDLCKGVRIEVTDREAFRAVVSGVAVVSAFRRFHPEEFRWRNAHFDRLAGVDWLREAIEEEGDPFELEQRWQAETTAWRENAARYWLYP
ncbi:exo-beta-N-acetylmuramidase NamZ domain-containing protein [Gemmatimonadota bacterium]